MPLQRRTPLRKTAFKPREGKVWKRMSPISKNKEKAARRFVPQKIINAIKIRSGGICEFVDENGVRCTCQAARTPHHLLKRSQGGKHTMENLKDSCTTHNMWAETEDGKKRGPALGWTILSSTQNNQGKNQ